MLLACSIENTTMSIGAFKGPDLLFQAELETSWTRTVDEYTILIGSLLAMHKVSPTTINRVIVGSVVRQLTAVLAAAIERVVAVRPLQIGPGVKTGLNIKTDIPSQVGADIVANAVASLGLLQPPLVIIDVGTATTLTLVNQAGELSGVLICPGLRPSVDALAAKTAELPRIALDSPRSLLGRNTNDSMVSGLVHGHAAMIDGLLARIAEQEGTTALQAIATGSLASRILPFCRHEPSIRFEPDLTLQGLRRIHELNERHRI
jgi:type III pantothenate kinase